MIRHIAIVCDACFVYVLVDVGISAVGTEADDDGNKQWKRRFKHVILVVV